MNHSVIYYSIGPLLYCPANNESIVSSLVHTKFGENYSLALCLEDTIPDHMVEAAEYQMAGSLKAIKETASSHSFYLPKIFIRVREASQIGRVIDRLGDCRDLVTGFILPKFAPDNADAYIQEFLSVNASGNFYIMPILESPAMVDLRNRREILYSLKEKLDQIESNVLNIRVGGNDLCNVFGFRRHVDEVIYDIKPIADILSDIVTVFGQDYVISGPVWEYFNGDLWEAGLKKELIRDKMFGFIGKTVIHPNQIPVVNQAFQVSRADYEDAVSILNWDPASGSLVSGNPSHERMNEFKTHCRWAERTIYLAQAYGILDQ